MPPHIMTLPPPTDVSLSMKLLQTSAWMILTLKNSFERPLCGPIDRVTQPLLTLCLFSTGGFSVFHDICVTFLIHKCLCRSLFIDVCRFPSCVLADMDLSDQRLTACSLFWILWTERSLFLSCRPALQIFRSLWQEPVSGMSLTSPGVVKLSRQFGNGT